MWRSMRKETPILFTGEMVLAILDGRKTQTRRIIKPQPTKHPDGFIYKGRFDSERLFVTMRSPYGVPGDKLWVRETFGIITGKHSQRWPKGTIAYRADHGETHGGIEYDLMRWKPSIFMPRKASRINLEVVTVRVERVQDIGRDGRKAKDVMAEGITDSKIEQWRKYLHPDDAPAHTYGVLWNSINGKTYPWESNPWVWVVEFIKL